MEFEEALVKVGEFGRSQCINYGLLVLPVVHSAIYMMTYVFTARDIPYRCFIPECDSAAVPDLEAPWLPWALPASQVPRPWPGDRAPDTCLRYSSKSSAACSADNFVTTSTERCNRWVFPEIERTIVSEFNLTCEDNRWKLTIVGSLNNFGQLLGLPLSGAFSDRFGRRWLLLLGLALSWVCGMARSWSPTYGVFLLFEFLDPFVASGICSASCILGMELVGSSKRMFGASVMSCFYSLGCAILGGLAWWQRDWRWLIRVAYVPAAISLVCVWLLPESVRWLLARDRLEAAEGIINKMAAVNGRRLSSPVRLLSPNAPEATSRRRSTRGSCHLSSPACTTGFTTACPGCGGRPGGAAAGHGGVLAMGEVGDRLRSASLQPESEPQRPPLQTQTLSNSQSPSTPNLLHGVGRRASSSLSRVLPVVGEQEEDSGGGWPLAQVCRSRSLMRRLCLAAFLWVVNSFVYFGLALRSVALAGDIYLNFVLAAAVEVPAYVLSWMASERWGRRLCVGGALAVTGASLLAFLVVPEGMVWVQLVLYMTGKLAICASFTVLYVFTAELFPTNARHSMIGVCATIGRMGSTLAPQTPLLEAFFWGLPILMFGLLSVAGAVVSLLLPETLNEALPDNVLQAEAVGRESAKKATKPATSCP